MMRLKLKYFGMLSEATQCKEETISFSQETVSDLINELLTKYPSLEEMDFQIAQNQNIVSKNTVISSSEIALLPPFAGG